jgi:hypothetical protein
MNKESQALLLSIGGAVAAMFIYDRYFNQPKVMPLRTAEATSPQGAVEQPSAWSWWDSLDFTFLE